MMHLAMRMCERMGFLRAPELDFHVDKDLTAKGVV
jgi:ribosome-binding factor A